MNIGGLQAQLHHVDVGGRRLAARESGAGPVVVFEVGAGGSGTGGSWNGVDERVAQFATSIVYDRAGLGASDRGSPHPDMAERTRDLAALLRGLDIARPVVLVGWSLGGLIAQHFAASHPRRVAALLLVDPTPVESYANQRGLARVLNHLNLPIWTSPL